MNKGRIFKLSLALSIALSHVTLTNAADDVQELYLGFMCVDFQFINAKLNQWLCELLNHWVVYWVFCN